MLLDLGANIYTTDMRKWTALHYASYNYRDEVVRLLCKYDDDKNKLRHMRNSQGRTAKEIVSKEKTKLYFESKVCIISIMGICTDREIGFSEKIDNIW